MDIWSNCTVEWSRTSGRCHFLDNFLDNFLDAFQFYHLLQYVLHFDGIICLSVFERLAVRDFQSAIWQDTQLLNEVSRPEVCNPRYHFFFGERSRGCSRDVSSLFFLISNYLCVTFNCFYFFHFFLIKYSFTLIPS